MAEESDLDISTLPIEEDNMDLDCESLIKALAFYNKIVEQSDSKEIKKNRENASRQRSGYRQDSREPEYLYCSTRGTYPGNGEKFCQQS
ncbi:hypothetical protein CEXT_4791 [Caerostris extrusa]|uniref:Uncharacterized protein n=1 Tax=Caerostris extrusa TaxID=172846 RepID=A0AAV4N0Q3_CAEEX|nr:hypothetical protein CEXT_4791 [Caerostris extrusa]